MDVPKVERQANLLALLLAVSRPVRLAEILSDVPGYPPGAAAARQAFERDKRELRAQGIPLATVLGAEPAYVLRREDYELPDLGLTEEETVALALALTAVRAGGAGAEEALQKLGAARADPSAVVALPSSPHLPVLLDAAATRSVARFGYLGARREVEPHGLVSRDGFWYLVGHDRLRRDRRVFRVDRVEDPLEVGEPDAFPPPERRDLRAALAEPWEAGADDPIDVDVEVDAAHAWRAVAEVGADRVVERRPGGVVVVRLRIRNRAALRSWVLGLRHHARVLGPPEVVDEVVGWLRAVAAGEPR